MRIAVPVRDGVLSEHFGQSPQVVMLEVDPQARTIISQTTLALPAHAPGAIPQFIIDQKADLVLTCGVGQRAVIMLADAGVRVIDGVTVEAPRKLTEDLLHDRLVVHRNTCSHQHHTCDHDHDHHQACDHTDSHDHAH